MSGSTLLHWAILAALGLFAASIHAAQPASDWKPVSGHIMTRWAKEVTPDNVLPEYPRPTMVRKEWRNLNGLWNYAILPDGKSRLDAPPGRILVPFPPESALSGVGKVVEPDQTLWYWRTFQVPAAWKGQRVLLHFGAVDWHARVQVNGKEVGEHKGGYDPFTFDITDFLKEGDNEIVVEVKDPTDLGGQPRGKQWLEPKGIWYTRTSGIWQTVWLEPVPPVAIDRLELSGSASDGIARVGVKLSRPEPGAEVQVALSVAGAPVLSARVSTDDPDAAISMRVPDVRAWSPSDPFLYDLRVQLSKDGKVLDEVTSYIGFRDITVGPDESGVTRLLLNGQALFQYGPLDQGFWPDGLYTAPTDEALRFDVEAVKKMGGNMLRKHVKVEPERLYYWCDKLGVLVWQDMPSPFFRNEKDTSRLPLATPEWKANFEREMREMVRDFGNHPSIVMWVPFNEGWGQNDIDWAREMAQKVKEWDPTRLVNNASGWTDMKVGDTYDLHIYPGPGAVRPERRRAGVLGEFGGLGLPVEGHTWVSKDNWGYVSYKTKEELTEAYVGLLKQMPLLIGQGLSAAVYTQTTDVEIEVNGWLTYDREVWKIDPAMVSEVTAKLYEPTPTVKEVLRHAGNGAKDTWRYTTKAPAADWFKPDFDDSGWDQGVAGFGREGTPGAVIGTKWETSDIWVRRSFELGAEPLVNPHLWIHHDEDAVVYINGEEVLSRKGYTTGYIAVPLSDKARSLLKPGKNTLAIHCRQTRGGQYIDAGLMDLLPPRATKARSAAYDRREIAGVPIVINRDFIRERPELLERVLVQLHADLDEILHMVPPAAADVLRTVPVWIELQGYRGMGHGGRGLCCHWSPAWLTANGLPAEKAGGVEIINPEDFLSWRRDQPYMLFHELAHAYHWRLGKFDAEIDRQYRSAMDKKLYDAVARNTVVGDKTVRAYAATNSHEYFAELSEAYFAVNDFAPYTRAQLREHDPEGLALVERLWNLPASEIAAAYTEREGRTGARAGSADR